MNYPWVDRLSQFYDHLVFYSDDKVRMLNSKMLSSIKKLTYTQVGNIFPYVANLTNFVLPDVVIFIKNKKKLNGVACG